MNSVVTELLNRIKKRVWLILLVFLIILILPSREVINEDFRVYDYSDSIQEDKTMHFDISITKHNKIPFISKKYDVLLEVDGRKYRYVASNFSERKETYIPFSTNVFDFGALLPNKDFSEFVILFDEDHHFDVSNEMKFIVYPEQSEFESMSLLKELLEYNNYDIEQRTMY